MSEHEFFSPGQADPEVMTSGTAFNSSMSGFELTAGALLRRAREAQGMHIAALAASLKVPVEKLEALEQDRFDLLLDAAFVRALASGVCRLLKLDPNPILQRLPSLSATKVPSQNWGINETFRSHSDPGSSLTAQLSKPVILVGLVLLLGAAALVFLPVVQKETAGKLVGQQASSEPSAQEPFAVGAPSTVQETVQNAAPAAPENPVGQPLPPAAGAVPSPGELAASAPAVAELPASALGQPVTPANPGDATLAPVATFNAKEASWVKVTDAKGAVVLQRMLQAGESAGVSGMLPLKAVVGRADAVEVQVRGQALDLNQLAKSNVARFEVK